MVQAYQLVLAVLLLTDAELSIFLLSAGVIGMLLLAIAIIIFFVLYQRRLFNQQAQIREMETNYQKSLLESVIDAQEAERKRIASDLHDDVGGLLSATKLYVKQLQIKMDGAHEELSTEAVELLDKTISNVRHITRNLLPPTLEQFGLIAAVEDRIKAINDLGNLGIHFDYNAARRFDVNRELSVFRIVQELVNNTLKHAEAQQIHIGFEFEENRLKVHYKDDGKGFDLKGYDPGNHSPKARGSGLGLMSLESRTNALNASLDYQSELGKGVEVHIEMEIEPDLKPQKINEPLSLH